MIVAHREEKDIRVVQSLQQPEFMEMPVSGLSRDQGVYFPRERSTCFASVSNEAICITGR